LKYLPSDNIKNAEDCSNIVLQFHSFMGFTVVEIHGLKFQ